MAGLEGLTLTQGTKAKREDQGPDLEGSTIFIHSEKSLDLMSTSRPWSPFPCSRAARGAHVTGNGGPFGVGWGTLGSCDSEPVPAGGFFPRDTLLWWRILGVDKPNLKGYNFTGRE